MPTEAATMPSQSQQLMPVSPGTRLGHYDVTALTNEGGDVVVGERGAYFKGHSRSQTLQLQ